MPIDKEIKGINNTVTVSVTTDVSDDNSTDEYHITAKKAASTTIVTSSYAPSYKEVPAPTTLHPAYWKLFTGRL